MATLTVAHFINCLNSQTTYKQSKVYINQILKENQKVYPIISKGLINIFQNKKVNLIAKMHALKFFKQIFQTAQFNCIQNLDQEVQNLIISIAQYKKESVQLNRGETYFIQIQERPDNKQTRQFGTSYLLFTLQLLMSFASWYPKDFQGDNSRFYLYYKKLQKQGVTFPKSTDLKYIKPSDKQKFIQNYKEWLKKQQQLAENEDKQENQVIESSKNQQKSRPSIPDSKIRQQQKQKQKKKKQQSTLKQDTNNINYKEKIQKLNGQIIQIKKTYEQKLQKVKKQSTERQKNIQKQLNNKVNIQNKLKNEIQKLNDKIKNLQKSKNEQGMNNLMDQLKNDLNNKQIQLKTYEQKFKKQKIQIQKKNGVQKQDKQTIKNLKNTIQKLQMQNQKNKMTPIVNSKQQIIKKLENQKNKLQVENNQSKIKLIQLEKQIQNLKITKLKHFQKPIIIPNVAVQTIGINTDPIQKIVQINNIQTIQIIPTKLQKNKLSKTQNKSLGKKQFKTQQNKQIIKMLNFTTNAPFQNAQRNTMKRTQKVSMTQMDFKSKQYTPISKLTNPNMNNFINTSNMSFSPNRKSIFGLKQLPGIQMKFIQQYFQPLDLSMMDFRLNCLKKSCVYFQNDDVQLRLQQLKNQRKFRIKIINLGRKQLKLQMNFILNKNYTLTNTQKIKNIFNLQGNQQFEQQIELVIESINFRFLFSTLKVNNYKMNLPIPITILKFCTFLKYNQNFEKSNQQKQLIRTQEFFLDRNTQSLQKFFGNLITYDNNQRFQICSLVKYEFDKDILIGLRIKGFKNKCVAQAVFYKYSQINQGFSKVLLQLIMFSFKADK